MVALLAHILFGPAAARLAFADDTSTSVEETFSNPAEWLENVFVTLTDNTFLSAFLTAVVCIMVTAVIAHLVTKLLHGLMEREILHISNTSVIVNIFRVCIWAIGISVILSTCFGIDVTGLVTALGIGGIALSLGLQDTIANLIGGLQVSILSIVKPGDYIEVGSCRGIVQDVEWRHTSIRDFNGTVYVIPNKNINTSTVTILPPSRKIKVEIDFVNNNGEDLEELKHYMLIAVKNEVSKVAAVDKDPVYRFSSVSEFSFQGLLIIWVNTQPPFDIYEVQDAIVRVIYDCTDEEQKALNRAALEKALTDAGAFYVQEIMPRNITVTVNRVKLDTENDPEANLHDYLISNDVPDATVADAMELGRGIINKVLAEGHADKASGLFVPVEISVTNYRNYRNETFNFDDVSDDERLIAVIAAIPWNLVMWYKDDIYSAKLANLMFSKITNPTNPIQPIQPIAPYLYEPNAALMKAGVFARLAARYGVRVVGTEIIGLSPMMALIDAADYYMQIENFDAQKQVLENQLL